MNSRKRHATVGVRVGKVMVGGGAPVVVQSMSNTDTVDVKSTAQQCIELVRREPTVNDVLIRKMSANSTIKRELCFRAQTNDSSAKLCQK